MPDAGSTARSDRTRRVLVVVLAVVVVAALTVLIYIIRADQSAGGNWPENFELENSDNGVLFQFAQDVFVGRPLDWTFSPQVFVFPEIPISLFAYLVAGGSVQAYFILVAAINNALLYLALFGVVRKLFPNATLGSWLGRSGLASMPLLFLPLVGGITLFEFPMAPTYYYGMYLVIIGAPLVFVTRGRAARWALGLAIALTIASNPLTIVFTVPALVGVALGRVVVHGMRAAVRPALLTIAIVGVALLVRLTLLTQLQGTSPLSYIDRGAVYQHRVTLIVFVDAMLESGFDTAVVIFGLAAAFVGVAAGIVALMRSVLARKTTDLNAQRSILLYYRFVPVTGLAASLILLILNSLYLWPVIIAPLVFALLEVPSKWARPAALTAAGVFVASAAVIAATTTATPPSSYLAYRGLETRCLDANLPKGMTYGYAAYFDARRIELPSQRGEVMIQLHDQGSDVYDWLTNRDYAADNVGTFFFVDAVNTGQFTLFPGLISGEVGQPDRLVHCSDGSQIMIYTTPSKLAKIASFYKRDE